MKKTIFILSSFFLICCSSDNSNETQFETITAINQINGIWKLEGKYNNGSETNVATSCDLEYGKFTFTSNTSTAIEKRGFQDTNCTETTYTYSDYNIVEGQLKLVRNNFVYKYYLSKAGNKMWLTKYYTQAPGLPVEIVQTNEQVKNYYTLQ